MKTEELWEQLIKEIAAQNRLIAMQLSSHNVDTCDKSDQQIIDEIQQVPNFIIKWSYGDSCAGLHLKVDSTKK